MSEQIWISREDAIKLVKESPWGRLKEPNVVRSVNILDAVAMSFVRERTVYGMSETEKKLLKFDVFIAKTIDQFCTSNPNSCRIEKGENQVDENALREFLHLAMDEEVSNEFGSIPDFKVS